MFTNLIKPSSQNFALLKVVIIVYIGMSFKFVVINLFLFLFVPLLIKHYL